MKTNKNLKISLLILAFALVFGAVFAMSASAETKKPEIISQNIKISKDFNLMFAVDASTVESGPVTLYVYDTENTTNAVPAEEITVSDVTLAEDSGNINRDVYVFITTKGISFRALTTEFYVKAVDNKGNESDVKRYSVAEYLYERLATSPVEVDGKLNPSAEQKEFYNSTIEWGKYAQLALDKNMTEDSDKLISNLRYVEIKGGKIDGFKAGVYPIGSRLAITPDAGGIAPSWSVTPYTDTDGTITAGTKLENKKFVEVTDSTKLLVEYESSVTIAYTNGFRDLDDIVPGSNLGASGLHTGGFGVSDGISSDIFKRDKDRGVIIHVENIPNGSSYVEVDARDMGAAYDATERTSFEFSADMKLDCSGDANDQITNRMVIRGSSVVVRYINFSQYDADGNLRDKLFVNVDDYHTEGKEFDVNVSDWFHVRMRVYADDPTSLYIYINTPEDGYTNEANYLKIEDIIPENDISKIAEQRFQGNDSAYTEGDESTYDGVSLDNIFAGYLNVDNPHK